MNVLRPNLAWVGLAVGLSMLALGPGCGASLPRAPAYPSDDEGFTQLPDSTPPGLDADPPVGLTVHPGDVLTLRLTAGDVSEVTGLTVDERGVVHIPLAGDVEVGGLSLTDAETALETAMRRYDRTVRITILIADPAGQHATIIGAVTTQGRVRVVPGMRVADLLAAAGGAASAEREGVSVSLADLHAARLVRGGEAVPISVARALVGDPRHNVRVRPGDHLYVPPELGRLVTIIGEVRSGTVVPHVDGMRLSQALGLAGGMTRDANGGDIRIIRGPSNSPRIYRAAIDHIAAGDHPDVVLAPGDVILVGSSALADMRDGTGAIAPIVSIMATTVVGILFAIMAGGG